MQIIDLKSREVFGDEGRGVAALVEEPGLMIRQVGLEPGREIPEHLVDDPVTIQVVHGEGLFYVSKEKVRIGPGKLLRIPKGVSMEVRNDSTAPLVFLVVKTPEGTKPVRENSLTDRPGIFVNFVEFAPIKPGKEEAFTEWFNHSSKVFARHPGFISRTLLRHIEQSNHYAAIVEHESKDTFMDMHLSDDRETLGRQVEPLMLGTSKPLFYEMLITHKNK